MNFSKFAFFISEIMLALISIILSSKIVFSVFSVESTDFHVVFFYVPNNNFGDIHVRDFFNPI